MAEAEWIEALERAYANAPWEEWVRCDPLWFVRRYPDPRDQEIVGVIASALAYGRVGCIMPSVQRVLTAMEDAPYAFVVSFDAPRDASRFAGFAHRFHTPLAIVAMLAAMRRALDRFGSLGEMFRAGHDPEATDTRASLTHFVARLRAFTDEEFAPAWVERKDLYGWRHYLASPTNGSACKRLNLFLRWMVRTGAPDLGVWTGVSPRQLLMPVDVHVAAISRQMGWTRRAAADLKMAEEITAALRRADPDDPTRFDFVISHLGMDSMEDSLR